MLQRMRPKLIIFDLDGTISDSFPGIFETYRQVARELGMPVPSDDQLSDATSGSIIDNIRSLFDLGVDEAKSVADKCLEFYNEQGWKMSEFFPGIHQLILDLHHSGYKLSIATMKEDGCAKFMVGSWGLEDCFVSVNGDDIFRSMSKSDIIERSLMSAGVKPEEAVMIGDSVNDYQGSRVCGVPFVAVAYGYGFTADVCIRNGICFAETADDLRKMFL